METLTLTIPEVARELRVGRTTVYRLIGSGELPSILVGGSRRVPAEALSAYTACPECRRITSKAHWVSVLAAAPLQGFGDGPEIYEYSPLGPNPRLVSDGSGLAGFL
jgi:excisionase family DNA binding protein